MYYTKEKAMNWAHVTGRRTFFLMLWHETSHRIVACQPTVWRSMLQAAKYWTENRKNRNSTRNNVYNSLLSAEYVFWLHKASLPGLKRQCHREKQHRGYIWGEKSLYYTFWLISCQQSPGMLPGWLGEIQAVTGHQKALQVLLDTYKSLLGT